MFGKKVYYLHVSYKVQVGENSWSEGDRLFKLTKCSWKELRQYISNSFEEEYKKSVTGFAITSITELSEGLFKMLSKGENFENLQNKEEE